MSSNVGNTYLSKKISKGIANTMQCIRFKTNMELSVKKTGLPRT